MRKPPDLNDESDVRDVQDLNVEDWMVLLLDLNPDYPYWGPHEDYMVKSSEHGWNQPVFCKSWKEFGPWELDEYNECCNFYFELHRDHVDCETCVRTGYHPDAQWITESFYAHSSPFLRDTEHDLRVRTLMNHFADETPDRRYGSLERGSYPSEEIFSRYGKAFRSFCEEMRDGKGCWNEALTDDEWDALIEHGRVKKRGEIDRIGHDAINRMILIEARCKRLGVPRLCLTCNGHGSVPSEPAGHVNLVLWMMHPRKGSTRGVEIQRIQKEDLPEVYRFLAEAAERNATRFSGVVAKARLESAGQDMNPA